MNHDTKIVIKTYLTCTRTSDMQENEKEAAAPAATSDAPAASTEEAK